MKHPFHVKERVLRGPEPERARTGVGGARASISKFNIRKDTAPIDYFSQKGRLWACNVLEKGLRVEFSSSVIPNSEPGGRSRGATPAFWLRKGNIFIGWRAMRR